MSRENRGWAKRDRGQRDRYAALHVSLSWFPERYAVHVTTRNLFDFHALHVGRQQVDRRRNSLFAIAVKAARHGEFFIFFRQCFVLVTDDKLGTWLGDTDWGLGPNPTPTHNTSWCKQGGIKRGENSKRNES